MATDITNWLSDAQEMHTQHPDTFWAPSTEELDAIKPDMHVKICDNEQRFWCTVKSTSGAHVVGVVADQTGHEDRGYGFGQNVTFEKRFVYAFADMADTDSTHAATLQQKLDEAATAGEIKEDLYRLLSTGMKRLREAELKEKGVDEGPEARFVIARYEPERAYFKLPEKIDTSKPMHVKWGTLHAKSKKGKDVKVHASHTTFDGENAPKWADKLEFVREKPWVWNGDPGVDSDVSDFDGGYCEFLK